MCASGSDVEEDLYHSFAFHQEHQEIQHLLKCASTKPLHHNRGNLKFFQGGLGYACGYLTMTLCGMTVFSGGVKQRANFRSWDSCSFTEFLCWFSSDFISACILMMPGVIISPGLLLDVATEMLDKVLK